MESQKLSSAFLEGLRHLTLVHSRAKRIVHHATLLYVVIFLGLTFPYWLHGDVLAPHRQSVELGIVEQSTKNSRIENRKLSDFSNGYIPEISEHLTGLRSGWLALWTNKNEMGRPLYQISGFSPAYLPTWVISRVTSNPWRLITIVSLGFCFLSGLFVMLFANEVGLHPLAGLLAAVSMATSPLLMYWLTFPMFLAVWCWAAGALWALTRLSNRADLVSWIGLAFSIYSLLMTAYPQPVVFHAYVLAGYGFVLVRRQSTVSGNAIKRFIVLAASATLVGVVLAFPVLRDLSILASESARVAPDASFFTAVLPRFSSVSEFVRFFVLSSVPEIFGNPIAPTYPASYDGLSVTMVMCFFVPVALFAAFGRTWGWALAIIILCVLALSHSLYILGVKYLGFNLSRSSPLGSVLLPIVIMCAFGVDAVARREAPRRIARCVVMAALFCFLVLITGIAFGMFLKIAIYWGPVFASVLVLGLLVAQRNRFRPVMLILSLVPIISCTAYPLLMRQPPVAVMSTSPIVEKIRGNLPSGSRYGVSAPGLPVLPPNLNATIGLASLHSYNSLSSKRFHTLIRALGGQVHTHGRYNGSIAPDYGGAMFWMSNIGLILSPQKIIHPNLEYLGEESSVHLHRVLSGMGEALQVFTNQFDSNRSRVALSDPRASNSRVPIKRADRGDVLEFDIESGATSLFILSQKFHHDWQAVVFTGNKWLPATTVEVNGVFQGVWIPSQSRHVKLEFKALSRFAWVAHVCWGLFIVIAAVHLLMRRWRMPTVSL